MKDGGYAVKKGEKARELLKKTPEHNIVVHKFVYHNKYSYLCR